MIDGPAALALTIAFVAGLGLGAFYFAGLWLTVRRITRSQRPTLLLASSFLIRSAIVVAGFYLLLAETHWERLLVAVLGFLLARTLLIKQWGTGRTAL